jgi:hypothetical protein
MPRRITIVVQMYDSRLMRPSMDVFYRQVNGADLNSPSWML